MNRIIARCLVILFVICATFAAPASVEAEPLQIMTAAEAAAVIPADELPSVKLCGNHNAEGFQVCVFVESNSVLKRPIVFTVSVNGGPALSGVISPVTAASFGGSSEWWYKQATPSSSFEGEILRILVPGTYAITAYVALNDELAISYSETFEVTLYDVQHWSFCQSGEDIVGTFYFTSLWESLPGQVWVGVGVKEFPATVNQRSPGFGSFDHRWQGWVPEVSLRIPGGSEGFEGTFRVPDRLWPCDGGGNTGKGSRTH